MSAEAKPIDYSIGTFSDDQLARVLHGFGIESFLVLPFFALNKTIIDLRRRTETARKVFIETSRGVFFLKELPWYCSSVPFAQFQSELQTHLSEQGQPVPALVPAGGGEWYFHDRRTGSIFLLQEYTDGRGWTTRPGEAETAGAALASLHHAAKSFGTEHSVQTRDAIETSRDLVSLLTDSRPESAGAGIADLAARSLKVIDECRLDAYARGYQRDRIPVHGDYNPFNLLYAHGSDAVTGILDFDNACVDNRAHDLGEAVVRFAWVRYQGLSSAYGEVPEHFDRESLRAVLAGYRAFDEEGAAAAAPFLPEVVTVIALELAAIGLLSSYYTGDDVDALHRNAVNLRSMAQEAIAEST